MSKKCRICFCSDERLSSLSFHKIVHVDENGSNIQINLVDIYEELAQVKYEHTDWEWICDGCQDKLIGYHKFRQLCRKSAQEINERQNDGENNEANEGANEGESEGESDRDLNFEDDNNSIEKNNESPKIEYDSDDSRSCNDTSYRIDGTESSNEKSEETTVK